MIISRRELANFGLLLLFGLGEGVMFITMVSKALCLIAFIVWVIFAYVRGRSDCDDRWVEEYNKLIDENTTLAKAQEETLEEFRKEVELHKADVDYYKNELENIKELYSKKGAD